LVQKLYRRRKDDWELIIAKALKFLKREEKKLTLAEDVFITAATEALEWDALQRFALN